MTKRKVGARAEWATDAVIEFIRVEYHKGTALREMAQRLNVSTNCVAAKIDRMELPQRPKAVRYQPWPREKLDEMISLHDGKGKTWREIAVIFGTSREAVRTRYRDYRLARMKEVPKPPPQPLTHVPRPVLEAPAWTPPPPLDLRTSTCCWPIGEPGTRTFRFCDAPTCHSRSPYCVDHHDGAYVRVFRDDTGRAYYGAGGVAAGAGAGAAVESAGAAVVEVFAATAAASACEELVTD